MAALIMNTDHYTKEGQTNLVDYGFIPGTESKLLLIKTGRGGNIYGYNNKYFRIAQHFNNVGYNVLCCSTPVELNDLENFQTTFEIAKELLGEALGEISISYIGFSRGAYQGILYGSTIPQIEGYLFINSPMTVNFHKQTKALRGIDKRCMFVLGTKDPSYSLWELICQLKNPNIEFVEVSGADHQFKNMDEELFELPIKMFLTNKED